MKINITHCYSDHNRGDLGIVKAIYDLAKKCGASEVNGTSVYSVVDQRFDQHHVHLRNVLDDLKPSIFPEPGRGNERFLDKLYKVPFFVFYLFRYFLLCLFPKSNAPLIFFSTEETKVIKEYRETDVFISKGGSFLYSFKGLSGTLFFIRILGTLIYPMRLGKKTIIFSQSLGPFDNKFAKYLAKKVLPNLDMIYLREEFCKRYLDGIPDSNMKVIPDAAFYLGTGNQGRDLKNKDLDVSITLRPHLFQEDINTMETYIEHVKNAILQTKLKIKTVYLVPQVIGPSDLEDDRMALEMLKSSLEATAFEVISFSKPLSIGELLAVYESSDILIGTRLHSSIFAMNVGTPSINIAYHGTKAQGVMDSVGLGDFVLNIENFNSHQLQSLMNQMIENQKCIVENMTSCVKKHRQTLLKEMQACLYNEY